MLLEFFVNRGALLLDRRKPGWELEVNPDEIDMGHEFNCVLAQIYGSYNEALRLLNLRHGWTYGFYNMTETSYDKLNALWRLKVTQRTNVTV